MKRFSEKKSKLRNINRIARFKIRSIISTQNYEKKSLKFDI